jgi:hypothetical protein
MLTEVGCSDLDDFPDSLYMARKVLNLQDNFQKFVACPNCHKLYQKKEVEDFQMGETRAIMKCQHIEFPNSKARRLRQCQASLSERTPANNDIKTKSILVFPFAGIRQQLIALYNRPGFENSLRHWINRPSFDDILADIYDGQV